MAHSPALETLQTHISSSCPFPKRIVIISCILSAYHQGPAYFTHLPVTTYDLGEVVILSSPQVSPVPSASSCNHHVFFDIPSPGYLIPFNLSNNLQHSFESLREENQKRPPREPPRIPASGLRFPCIHPRHTSRPSGRYRSSSKRRRQIDEMAQPYR